MTTTVRVLSGRVEPLTFEVRDQGGDLLPGKADLFVRVRRQSDGFFLDHADDTFKAAGWTTLDASLVEVDATLAPGIYGLPGGLDTGAITNAAADDDFQIIATQSPGTDAVLPPAGELKIDQWPAHLPFLRHQGAIWIDSSNGTAGTVVGVNGIPENPVLSLADAATLAAATGLRRYVLIAGSFTLVAALTEWAVELQTDEVELDLAGFSVNGSTFRGGKLKGIGSGTIAALHVHLEDVSGVVFNATECGLSGTIGLGVGESTFDRCHSREPGLGFVTFDFVAAGRSVNLRDYMGGALAENMVDASNVATFAFQGGAPRVDSSCTAGTLDVRGWGKPIVDGSAGTTVITAAYGIGSYLTESWRRLGLDAANEAAHKTATETVDGFARVPTDGSLLDLLVERTGDVVTVTRQ